MCTKRYVFVEKKEKCHYFFGKIKNNILSGACRLKLSNHFVIDNKYSTVSKHPCF